MINRMFNKYLANTKSIEAALEALETNCLRLNFFDLYRKFESDLGIKSGDGFPITAVTLGGLICRARLNTPEFKIATKVDQSGAKTSNISQGRANPNNISVFYGANNKKTAMAEVLQEKIAGQYVITIGCWKSLTDLRVVNLVHGSDPDFSSLSFAHSMPRNYIKDWPDEERNSALLLFDYFREKFKQMPYPGLYNITNIISAIFYSLQDVNGIGYAAISDKFGGYNVAIPNPTKLKCLEVERWFVDKLDNETYEWIFMNKGSIDDQGFISWP